MIKGRSPVPVYALDGGLGQFGLFSTTPDVRRGKRGRISSPEARMTSNVLELGRVVAEYPSSFGGVTVRVLPDESHHTILGSAATLGLRFLIGP